MVLAPDLVSPTIVDYPADDRIVVASRLLVRVWDLELRAATANFDIEPGTQRPAVSADGHTLLHIGLKGLSRLPLDPPAWAAHLCRVVGRDATADERGNLPAGSPTGSICPWG
jgi:hypothetical protein